MDERGPAADRIGAPDDEDRLRDAIRTVVDNGWECVAGREVLEALEDRAPRWARSLDARMGNQPDSTDPADVLRTAWLTVHTFGAHVAESKTPWTYLWTTVRRALAVDNTEQACLSSGVLQLYRERGEAPPTAVRAGVDTAAWEETVATTTSSDFCADWSPALRAFVRVIVDAGGEEPFWTDAVGRAVDVMADARHSYQEWALRRDPYLTGRLGLLPRAERTGRSADRAAPRRPRPGVAAPGPAQGPGCQGRGRAPRSGAPRRAPGTHRAPGQVSSASGVASVRARTASSLIGGAQGRAVVRKGWAVGTGLAIIGIVAGTVVWTTSAGDKGPAIQPRVPSTSESASSLIEKITEAVEPSTDNTETDEPVAILEPDAYAEHIALLVFARDTREEDADDLRARLLSEADPTLTDSGLADLIRMIDARVPEAAMWTRMRANQQWSEWQTQSIWEPGAWQQAVTSGFAEPGWTMRNVSGLEVTHYVEDGEDRITSRERTISVLMRCPAPDASVDRCHLALLSTTPVA